MIQNRIRIANTESRSFDPKHDGKNHNDHAAMQIMKSVFKFKKRGKLHNYKVKRCKKLISSTSPSVSLFRSLVSVQPAL